MLAGTAQSPAGPIWSSAGPTSERGRRPPAARPRTAPDRRPEDRSRPRRRRSQHAPRPRSSARVFRATAATRAGRAGRAIRSCSSTSAPSGGMGCGPPPAPSIAVRPASWQSTSTCGALPWNRPSVTPEYAGCTSDPWPSTHSSSPPRAAPSTTSRSAAPAMKSATTASTAIPQPAIAIPVWPVGTNSDRSPRRRASRSSSSDTVIFPIAQSEPTVRTIVPGTARFAPVGSTRPSAASQVAQLDAARRRELAKLGVVREELVQPVLDVEAGSSMQPLQDLDPRRREPPALRGDADERRRRLERQRILDGPDDRERRRPPPPRACESRIATTSSRR